MEKAIAQVNLLLDSGYSQGDQNLTRSHYQLKNPKSLVKRGQLRERDMKDMGSTRLEAAAGVRLALAEAGLEAPVPAAPQEAISAVHPVGKEVMPARMNSKRTVSSWIGLNRYSSQVEGQPLKAKEVA
jgi:hypothetical protein